MATVGPVLLPWIAKWKKNVLPAARVGLWSVYCNDEHSRRLFPLPLRYRKRIIHVKAVSCLSGGVSSRSKEAVKWWKEGDLQKIKKTLGEETDKELIPHCTQCSTFKNITHYTNQTDMQQVKCYDVQNVWEICSQFNVSVHVWDYDVTCKGCIVLMNF